MRAVVSYLLEITGLKLINNFNSTFQPNHYGMYLYMVAKDKI
jgi:hypothetical protein